MPTERKLSVFFGFPVYGCTGGPPTVVASLLTYMTRAYAHLYHARESGKDKRLGSFSMDFASDTPATLTRNRLVKMAREAEADVLVMLDSDQDMLLHTTDFDFKPWFDSCFDFIYNNYDKGPHVIAAPYCGPPTGDHENMFVFRWRIQSDRGRETMYHLDQYTREEAALMSGICEAAALPTGAIMYDMRCFDLIEPPYFRYEYKDKYETEKMGTEDVTNTRDISIAGLLKYGYNPVYCNWDSPVGHWKPWLVPGRPKVYSAACVSKSLQKAILDNIQPADRLTDCADSRLLPKPASREAFIAEPEVLRGSQKLDGTSVLLKALGNGHALPVSH